MNDRAQQARSAAILTGAEMILSIPHGDSLRLQVEHHVIRVSVPYYSGRGFCHTLDLTPRDLAEEIVRLQSQLVVALDRVRILESTKKD